MLALVMPSLSLALINISNSNSEESRQIEVILLYCVSQTYMTNHIPIINADAGTNVPYHQIIGYDAFDYITSRQTNKIGVKSVKSGSGLLCCFSCKFTL